MQPRNCRNSLPQRTIYFCLLLFCLGASAVPAFATGRGHVVIRADVTGPRKLGLVNKLRAITGWSSLTFDSEGVLRLGTDHPNHGSQGARELLTRAVNESRVIVIEDASSRADVAFCRVVPGRWLSNNGVRLPAFVVLIDFADFGQLLGDAEARASFDVGWGLLHELDHVVNDSRDTDEQGTVGECESHINAMRQEMGLPLRIDYFFSESLLRTDPNFGNKLVRLAFERYDSSSARQRRYWLAWDSTVVGGLIVNGQTAAVRSVH